MNRKITLSYSVPKQAGRFVDMVVHNGAVYCAFEFAVYKIQNDEVTVIMYVAGQGL